MCQGCGWLVSLLAAALYAAVLHWSPVNTALHRRWCHEEYKSTDCGRGTPRGNVTGLRVVLPSFGQTGTTSLIMALRELGYRAYHADDYAVFAKPVMFYHISRAYWAQSVSRCGMEAISLEPISDAIPWAVDMSPQAKFILTWRDFPSWRDSARKSRTKDKIVGFVLTRAVRANRIFPWVELLDRAVGNMRRMRLEGGPLLPGMTASKYMYRLLCNAYSWPIVEVMDRGTYKGAATEEAYIGHIDEIRRLVPPGRLLEFDVRRHGWAELARFLGVQAPAPGTPFPRPRSKELRTNEPLLERNPWTAGVAVLWLVCMHVLNYLAMCLALRASLAFLVGPARRLLIKPDVGRDWLDE